MTDTRSPHPTPPHAQRGELLPDGESSGALPPELMAAMEQLDDLIERFQSHPEPMVQERALALLRCVDAVHRPGLRRLAGLLREAGLLEPALATPEVRLLFELYEVGEGGDRARADAVLDAVRPYIESHGGRLEVVEAVGGVVKVRLAGACHGCAGSAATLQNVIEQALRSELTDFVRMEVVQPPQRERSGGPTSFIPVTSIAERPRLVWHPTVRADEVPPGGLLGIEVRDEPVLLVAFGDELYAYRNRCPGTPFPLHGGRVEEGAVVCPYHGCRFAARGGKRLQRDGPGLGVVPIAVQDGMVRIGVLEEKSQCA